MMTHQTHHRATCGITVKTLAVLALCFGTAASAQATNTVTGLAYGTNYAALATAGSISSTNDSYGTLIVGYAGTTNLTLSHAISGFVAVTNKAPDFTVDATGATVTGSNGTAAVFMAMQATNLTLSGGQFLAGGNASGSVMDSAGGWATNSVISITGSEFAGTNNTAGFIVQGSEFTSSNSVFRGGNYGWGLYVTDDSTATIHSGSFIGGEGNTALYLQDSDATIFGGSFTGGVGSTAIYLLDSDATIYDGSFIGNIDGPTNVVGTGLFSELTDASTNAVALHGGTFSGLAFYGVDGSVQQFLAGTNLVVQDAVVQNGGTVIVDNQSDAALQQVYLLDGTMSFMNDYTLMDGGLFSYTNGTSEAVFSSLTLDSGAVFNMGLGNLSASSGITLHSGSELSLTASNTASIVADTVTFHTNSTLIIDASAGSSQSTNDLNILETTTGIFVDNGSGATNATTANFNSNVNLTVETDWLSTYNGAFIDNGNTLRLQLITQSWSEGWEAEGQLDDLADELQLLDDGTMGAVISDMGKDESKAAVERTYFTTYNTFETVLNGIQAAVGQSASRGAEFREQTKLRPSGARGPQHSSALRGWAKYYGQRLDHDPEGLNPAYETSLDGGVVGVDMSFGTLLAGIAGGWGTYVTESGSNGEEEINAYHGALYSTMGLDTAYIDAGIAYGFNEVETRTGGPFVLNGEFDAQILSAYLGGGIDFVDSTEGMVFTPEASVQYSMYEQDDYTETGTAAVPRRFGSFDADSLRTSLGINVSVQDPVKMETFQLKYDVRLHWIHEFNPEPGSMNFSLDGGNNGYQLAHPLLDEDYYRAGIGAVFSNTLRNQPKNVLFRIDFDEIFGDGFSSHNLSLKVIYAF